MADPERTLADEASALLDSSTAIFRQQSVSSITPYPSKPAYFAAKSFEPSRILNPVSDAAPSPSLPASLSSETLRHSRPEWAPWDTAVDRTPNGTGSLSPPNANYNPNKNFSYSIPSILYASTQSSGDQQRHSNGALSFSLPSPCAVVSSRMNEGRQGGGMEQRKPQYSTSLPPSNGTDPSFSRPIPRRLKTSDSVSTDNPPIPSANFLVPPRLPSLYVTRVPSPLARAAAAPEQDKATPEGRQHLLSSSTGKNSEAGLAAKLWNAFSPPPKLATSSHQARPATLPLTPSSLGSQPGTVSQLSHSKSMVSLPSPRSHQDGGVGGSTGSAKIGIATRSPSVSPLHKSRSLHDLTVSRSVSQSLAPTRANFPANSLNRNFKSSTSSHRPAPSRSSSNTFQSSGSHRSRNHSTSWLSAPPKAGGNLGGAPLFSRRTACAAGVVMPLSTNEYKRMKGKRHGEGERSSIRPRTAGADGKDETLSQPMHAHSRSREIGHDAAVVKIQQDYKPLSGSRPASAPVASLSSFSVEADNSVATPAPPPSVPTSIVDRIAPTASSSLTVSSVNMSRFSSSESSSGLSEKSIKSKMGGFFASLARSVTRKKGRKKSSQTPEAGSDTNLGSLGKQVKASGSHAQAPSESFRGVTPAVDAESMSLVTEKSTPSASLAGKPVGKSVVGDKPSKAASSSSLSSVVSVHFFGVQSSRDNTAQLWHHFLQTTAHSPISLRNQSSSLSQLTPALSVNAPTISISFAELTSALSINTPLSTSSFASSGSTTGSLSSTSSLHTPVSPSTEDLPDSMTRSGSSTSVFSISNSLISPSASSFTSMSSGDSSSERSRSLFSKTEPFLDHDEADDFIAPAPKGHTISGKTEREMGLLDIVEALRGADADTKPPIPYRREDGDENSLWKAEADEPVGLAVTTTDVTAVGIPTKQAQAVLWGRRL